MTMTLWALVFTVCPLTPPMEDCRVYPMRGLYAAEDICRRRSKLMLRTAFREAEARSEGPVGVAVNCFDLRVSP